jgi:peptidoglycan hydrolase-like protein with peptidoglycan-binding domain
MRKRGQVVTLADVLNSPTEKEFEGNKYKLRQMTVMEEGEFQRWMEQLAYDAIERRTYQDPTQQERDRKNLNNDIAAGVYEWGQELAVRRFQSVKGLSKILYFVCRDQGLDEEAAQRWAMEEVKKLAAILVQRATGTDDPKDLRVVCLSLGLPPDFLSSSLTHPSTAPSATSEACAEPSSSNSTKSSEAPTG